MKINRLFEIVYILLDKKTITANELATHFEVSTRTIYRDIEILSSGGIPIYMTKGKGRGVSLLPDFVLNKTVLTQGEQSDILSALNAVRVLSCNETDTAIHKLSSLFGGVGADWVEIDFSSWGNGKREIETFEILKPAIIHKKTVSFTYAGGNGVTTDRAVEPLKLCFKGQAWYLYAYCKGKKDFRFFRLSRIRNLTTTEESFTQLAPVKIFGGEQFSDDFITITLKIAKKLAFRVYDEFEDYTQLPAGDFLANMIIPRGDWIFYYVATFGENCEVLEPLDIRLQVKEKLQKIIGLY